MGNQPGKTLGAKGSKGIYEVEKKSRTGWQPGVPESPGKPMIQLSSRIAPQDDNSVTDEINLYWSTPKDDGGFPITGYKIEMLDIQNGTWIEITYIEGFEPRCTLSNILYGIMYRFRAIAFNDAGPSEASEPSDPVVIDVPGVQIAPYFVLMLNDTIALEHEKIEFRVKVLGTPKPSIQWYKDDMEIFSSDRLEIREEEDGGVVIVKEARLSDSGNIKCVATNILGRATSVAQLMIEAAPRLDVPETYMDGLIFRHDEVIRLKIPMIAKPAPRVTWFFEDEPICPSDDLQIETTDTMTSIRVGAAKRWHCGEFRVLAQNENGEDSASLLVTVTAPPSAPGKAVIIDITGTTCTIRWEPSQDDGGADIKHYLVEYFRDVWDVWLKAKTTKECQDTIEDLIPGSRYKFRIKAENAYGISEESEESDAFDVGGVPTDQGHTVPSFPEEDPAWSPEQDPAWVPPAKTKPDLKTTKRAWDSEESSEDVLKDLLRVKKLSQRVDSTESDGLPSMASIDAPDDLASELSESSDLQRARKLYAELQMMSNDSAEAEGGDLPDLDTAAKEFYDEIRMLSMDRGGTIDNILDNIGISSDSLNSIIPSDKRQELVKFEMTLKDMIEEAKMMAATPDRILEDITIPLVKASKSASVGSQEGSVISVIEAADEVAEISEDKEAPKQSLPQDMLLTKTASPKVKESPVKIVEEPDAMDDSQAPPLEFMSFEEQRYTPPVRQTPPQLQPIARQTPPQIQHIARQTPPQPQPKSRQTPPQLQPIPTQSASLPRQTPPTVRQTPPQPEPTVRQTPPQPAAPQTAAPQTMVRRPGTKETAGEREERQRSVGSDRYEEIIQTRRRSQSRPGSGMGSRTTSQNDFRSSQTSFRSQNDFGRLDLDALKTISAGRPNVPDFTATNGYHSATPVKPPIPTPSPAKTTPIPPQPTLPVKPLPPLALDANQNSTPVVPPAPAFPRTTHSPSLSKDPLVKLFPRNIPHWFVITYTYSVVLILILLIANVTPDGKLFIHFTAFWSLVLYFMLEDDQTCDILDSVVERYIKK